MALMVLLQHCVHQTHIKHHAKTILLMLIKQHFRFKIYIITIHYNINKNGDIIHYQCKIHLNVPLTECMIDLEEYYKKFH